MRSKASSCTSNIRSGVPVRGHRPSCMTMTKSFYRSHQGYTFWELHSEAPDLFLHLSQLDLVFFKGNLSHRKLTYDCAAPASTPFDIVIGSMASSAGAPKVCSPRTIKGDVVVGLPSDEIADNLNKEEDGWKISGKYVRCSSHSHGTSRSN
jgi:hypothetical protein